MRPLLHYYYSFHVIPKNPRIRKQKQKCVFLSGLLVNVASAIGRMAEDVETIEQVNYNFFLKN